MNSSLQKITLLGLLLLLSSLIIPPPIISSQDNPTETPTEFLTETAAATATEAPSPTETATLLPTLTETPLPSETTAATEAPTPSETATETASATVAETVTETPTGIETTVYTPTSTLTSLPLNLIFSDNFDRGDFNWRTSTGWFPTTLDNNRVLGLFSSFLPAYPLSPVVSNVAVETQILLNSGKFYLAVRKNDASGYSVSVATNGLIELYRNDILVTSALVSPLSNGQWHTLYLSAIGDTVGLRVDGVEVINFVDSLPLPLGEIVIRGQDVDHTGLFIDNFSIWSEGSPASPAAQLNTNNLPTSTNIQPLISGTDMLVYRNESVNPSQFYSMDGNGGSQFNWEANSSGLVFGGIDWPALSPDGKWILFKAHEEYLPGTQLFIDKLKVIDTISRTISTLYNFPQNKFLGKMSWKPDSIGLAFTSTLDVDGSNDIWAANFNATDLSITPPTNITNSDISVVNGSPDWGTNGLIYTEILSTGQRSIKIVYNTIAFFAPSFPPNTPNIYALGNVAWSPDGTRVVYSLQEKLQINDYHSVYNLFYFNVNNGNPIRITSDNGSDYNRRINNLYPDWSQGNDGNSWIFFSREDSLNNSPGQFPRTIRRIQISGQNLSDSLGIGTVPSVSNNITIGTVQSTPTPTPVSCSNIQFSEARNVRERPDISNSNNILGQVTPVTNYTAFYKYVIGAEMWIYINFNGMKGWSLAQDIATTYITNIQCINSPSFLNYAGNFPNTWYQIAQITQTEVLSFAGDPMYYLYTEGSQDIALLLARLAIAESSAGLSLTNYYNEVIDIAWTVRVRALLGLLNYNSPTRCYPDNTPTNISDNFTNGQCKVGAGKAGASVSILDDLILSNLSARLYYNLPAGVNPGIQYQPIFDFGNTLNLDPSTLTNNMARAFYPRDVFQLEDLYRAYVDIQNVLGSSWNNYSPRLMTTIGSSSLQGFDHWVGNSVIYVRLANGDSRYPPVSPRQINFGNTFYDVKILDTWFFQECVNNGKQLNAATFPVGPFNLVNYAPSNNPLDGNLDAIGPLPTPCP